jgi:hypothetical protein
MHGGGGRQYVDPRLRKVGAGRRRHVWGEEKNRWLTKVKKQMLIGYVSGQGE